MGCQKKEEVANSSGAAAAAAPKVDVSADTGAAQTSWVLGVALEPAPLTALASGSPGWAPFFAGDAAESLAGFEKNAGSSPDAALGAVRAARELSRAEAVVAQMVVVATPRVLAALDSREGSAETAAPRAWIEARHAAATGRPPDAALAKIGADSPVHAWRAALEGGDEAAKGLLLGKAAAEDGPVPDGGTDAYGERLQVRAAALVDARLPEARKRAARIDPKDPDLSVGAGDKRTTLRDPLVADFGARLMGRTALSFCAAAGPWSALHCGPIHADLGDHASAVTVLYGFLASPPPGAPPLAAILNSEALGREDALALARAELVRAHAGAGDEAAARAALGQLPEGTIGQRVLKAWAGSFLGESVPKDVFPEDRDVLAAVLNDAITEKGDAAKGAADATALALVDRYVDAVQRRFADALRRSGQLAEANKVHGAAEDKTNAMAPSPRNRLPALANAALDNLRIGRPRVALKYLSRLDTKLPAAAAPAEMLRDLLTLRAMEQAGGAATGQ
jgi:hypothetical protein